MVFRAQAVSVPPRFCDDRVKVLQGDAREISPLVLQEYAPEGFDTVLSDMVRKGGRRAEGMAECGGRLPANHLVSCLRSAPLGEVIVMVCLLFPEGPGAGQGK